MKSVFGAEGYSASCSPPDDTTAGAHGAGIMALNKSWQHKVLHNDCSSAKLAQLGVTRVAGKISFSHHFEILCIIVSWWCSEGLERKISSYTQVYILERILKITLACAGDCTILDDDFVEPGWTEQLNVEFICPGCATTLPMIRGRVTGYSSIGLETFQAVSPVRSVAWVLMWVLRSKSTQSLNLSLPCFRSFLSPYSWISSISSEES